MSLSNYNNKNSMGGKQFLAIQTITNTKLFPPTPTQA